MSDRLIPFYRGVVIDLNRLTYREYRQYIEAGAAGDEIAILCKVVVAWAFEGDPADPASYDDLGILDFMKIQTALRLAIGYANYQADGGTLNWSEWLGNRAIGGGDE